MIVAITTWELHLPACHSLKEKRGVLKPLTAGLRRSLNLSVAETGHQDLWQRAEIACAAVGSARTVVDETLRQVITDGLTREVRDPRVGFVTITGVLVTNDLSHARVMVSVPGEETEKARALEGLQSAAGFLRSRAARALTTRTVPELHFELDRGLEHAARINELLNTIRQEDPD